MRVSALNVVLAVAVLAAPAAAAADDVVLQAMQDEMERSVESLAMEDLSAPYFVAYRVDDVARSDTAASFGSLLRAEEGRDRWLDVEVRVGEPALDNTNFLTMSFDGGFGSGGRLPLEDSYRELRRQLWLATDAAYKQALEDLAKKKAALQNKTRTDEVPDFAAQEPAQVATEVGPPAIADLDRSRELVRSLSELFRGMPDVHSSTVRVTTRVTHSRYVNSEGSTFKRVTPELRFTATASTQAPDGMQLKDAVTAYGRSLDDLPDADELATRIRTMGARLAALRTAELLDTYNGPVLFEGQAAAEVLAQGFVPALLASRKPVTDSPQMEMFIGDGSSPFADKLGARVLPRFLAVVDDPTADARADEPLLGGAPVDDDGVPATATTVVERGRLRTLLTTRNPIRGVTASTGSRRGPGPAPSNILVTTDDPLAADELEQELFELAADAGSDFAVVVRRVSNPVLAAADDPFGTMMVFFGPGGPGGQEGTVSLVEAYKVYPDGREELVRNLEVGGLDPGAFKDIVAVSDSAAVVTLPFEQKVSSPFAVIGRVRGRPGDSAPLVSVVTPALLFEELTLKKPTGEIPNPPVARHPYFADEEDDPKE